MAALTRDRVLALAACASSLLAEPAVAQQQPALAPGYARVWILRQYEPSESLRTPVMYINGASIGASQPGTIFYRDLPAGAYQVTVDSCTKDVGQDANLNLAPGMQVYLEIQSLSSSMRPRSPCLVRGSRDTGSRLGAREADQRMAGLKNSVSRGKQPALD